MARGMAAALEEFDSFIRDKVEKKWTHKAISFYLMSRYQGTRGLSTRSLQRYCSVNNIHKTSRLNDQDLDVVVSNAASKVTDCLYCMYCTYTYVATYTCS